MSFTKYILLSLFFLFHSVIFIAQTFTTIIPHPHHNQAFGVAETTEQDFIVVVSQSESTDFSTHQLQNTLKAYKLDGLSGVLLDSTVWTAAAPYEDWGVALITNITEAFPIPNQFILSGSINSPDGNQKRPFFVWIDEDLNILKDTILGSDDKKEALYQSLLLNDSTLLWHGCSFLPTDTDCTNIYQVEMTLDGTILAEREITGLSEYLGTSYISRLDNGYVLHSLFKDYAVFLDDTFALDFIVDNPYGNGLSVYAFRTTGHSYSIPNNQYILPGWYSWIDSQLNTYHHHSFIIFDEFGNMVDSVIIQDNHLETLYPEDCFLVTEDAYYGYAVPDYAGLFAPFGIFQKLSIAGEVLWERVLETENGQDFRIFALEQTNDGGFILVGGTLENQDAQGFILKLDGEGNLVATDDSSLIQVKDILVYPTILESDLIIQTANYEGILVTIYDKKGQLYEQFALTERHTSRSISHLPSGSFMATFSKANEIIQVDKLVKL